MGIYKFKNDTQIKSSQINILIGIKFVHKKDKNKQKSKL